MKTNQAYKRVFKKLSAVRATLPTAEREVLDNIIVDEVKAHSLDLGKVSGKATGKAAGKTSGKAMAKAHAMNLGKTSGKASGKAAGKASGKAAGKTS